MTHRIRRTLAYSILIALFVFATIMIVSDIQGSGYPYLRVSGARLVDAQNQQVIMHGVDRSGAEYACVSGTGIFKGPTGQASVTAMKSWGINAVRLPLNEACWNGQSYVNPKYAGRSYRSAIKAYVKLLGANGIYVILDLHWTDGSFTAKASGCTSAKAICQKPMPDLAQSVPFWTSVADTFKGNDDVIFDLFNEPFSDRAMPSRTAAWQCWLYGAKYCAPEISYPVAGMQTLVNTVRAAGADNVIMVGGIGYSNDLTDWLRYEPSDPDHNLVASWHSYSFSQCASLKCWTEQVRPVIAKVPVIVGEIGEHDCSDHYVTPLMSWLDQQRTSYLVWSWNAAPSCQDVGKLITNWSGSPTTFGSGVKAHLSSLAGARS